VALPASHLVATAVARTGVYYKRSGLTSAGIALLSSIAVLLIEDTIPKGILLASAVFFAVIAWRAVKSSTRYFDPASPVLRAILRDHERIARVRSEPVDDKGVVQLVVEDDQGSRLELRVNKANASKEMSALFDAFAELAPDAELQRDGY
jgi:hypothetical protein